MNLSLFNGTTRFLNGSNAAGKISKDIAQKSGRINSAHAMRMAKTDESGRSLIEMLGTIAIITMLTVGGMTGAGYAMQAWRANNAADDIEQAVLGVQDLYSWQKDYTGLSMSKICQNDVLSRDCVNNTHWDNPFGGTMTIEPYDGALNFRITLTDVPAASCRNLVNRSWEHVGSVTVSGGSCPEGRQGIRTLYFTPY